MKEKKSSTILSLRIGNQTTAYLLLSVWAFVASRKGERWADDTYMHLIACAHTITQRITLTLKASLNQSIKHLSGFRVWRSVCCPWASAKYAHGTKSQLCTFTHMLPNKSMSKCHVAVVTEHEWLPKPEPPHAGLQWLMSLMNSSSLSLRKSAVSELADILLLPLLSAARDCSLHLLFCVRTHTHTLRGRCI